MKEYDYINYNCWDFVTEYMKNKYNIILENYNSYALTKNEENIFVKNECVKYLDVTNKEKKNGDLIIIKLYGGWLHIGVYENGYIIHNMPKVGIITEPYARYNNKIVGVYRCL